MSQCSTVEFIDLQHQYIIRGKIWENKIFYCGNTSIFN
jgi:hypothetical protein